MMSIRVLLIDHYCFQQQGCSLLKKTFEKDVAASSKDHSPSFCEIFL